MTITISELEIIEGLDFEVEAPCAPRSDSFTCDNPATWMLSIVCCGAKSYLCDEHQKKNSDFKQVLADIGMSAHCKTCGHTFEAPEIMDSEIETRIK